MMFPVNPSSGVPAYRQIVDQVKRLVAAGQLLPGERLPSVRALAQQVGLNPMTVAKAYRLLTVQRAVNARVGKGVFVAPPIGRLTPQARRQAMAGLLDQVAAEALQLDVPADEVVELLRERFNRLAGRTAPRPVRPQRLHPGPPAATKGPPSAAEPSAARTQQPPAADPSATGTRQPPAAEASPAQTQRSPTAEPPHRPHPSPPSPGGPAPPAAPPPQVEDDVSLL